MKTFIIISWRNIWRQKRRSMVVISSVAFGIFSMIFSIGFMNGMNIQMVENTISTSLGHIAIHKKGFHENMKLAKNFTADSTMYKIIKENESVTAFAPKIKLQGLIRSPEAARGVMIVGIDPEREKKVSSIYNYTSKKNGSAFLSDPSEQSILISKAMADKLDLMVGERCSIAIPNQEKEIEGIGLTVKGIYESPVGSFDKFVVFVGIDLLQEKSGIGKNISEITVILKDKSIVNGIKESLIKKINNSDLEILSWMDMAPNLVSAIKLFDTMMYIFFSIIFITVIFSVANTLIMAIMERFHEIGVMKSIGTRPSKIFSMIIYEAMSLGIVGLVLGIGAGILLVFILSFTGIDLSFYMESMKSWGTGSIIYPAIKFMDIAMAIQIVFFTTIIAAIYPAAKAAKIKPLEALNYI